MHTIALPAQSGFAPPPEARPLAVRRRARALAGAPRRRVGETNAAPVLEPVALAPVAEELAPQVAHGPAAWPTPVALWCHGCGATEHVVACARCHISACGEHVVCLPDRSTVCVGCALVASGVRRKRRQPARRAGRAWLRL